MLTLLKIKNIALIDDLSIEFGDGLNLLTGETGSGKSIIVDSLGALTGERVSSDLIRQGEDSARIEGLFAIDSNAAISSLLDESGIDAEGEIIIRRELSLAGKNRVFVNNQLVTQNFLKRLGPLLADIHGQGEQAGLYDVETHAGMLDDFANVEKEKAAVEQAYDAWSAVKSELIALRSDESEKLQLLDILRFQVDEIKRADLVADEDTRLDDEKRRLNNVEKLSALSAEAHALLYDDERSTMATLDRASKIVCELAEFDERFQGFDESLDDARAVVDELGMTARDFGASLECSPDRLNEIENRLAEIARLKRKYGGSIETVLEHLAVSEQRLANIETAELRETELAKHLAATEERYLDAAGKLNAARVKAAMRFEKTVVDDLRAVALDKAIFEVRFDADTHKPDGTDHIEFYFSANPGEHAKPLAKVASGGEASRLMLILKTSARSNEQGKTVVFDEIDIGIGGRVAEAVGRKLKTLAAIEQVFCVTHQPQIASLADRHFVVEKTTVAGRSTITVRELAADERLEEIARMLAGEQITEAARENARSMLAEASDGHKKAQKAQT